MDWLCSCPAPSFTYQPLLTHCTIYRHFELPMTILLVKQLGNICLASALLKAEDNRRMQMLFKSIHWGKQDHLFHNWADFALCATHMMLSIFSIKSTQCGRWNNRTVAFNTEFDLFYKVSSLCSCRLAQEQTCCSDTRDSQPCQELERCMSPSVLWGFVWVSYILFCLDWVRWNVLEIYQVIRN